MVKHARIQLVNKITTGC